MDVAELIRTTTAWFKQRGVDTARLDAELLIGHALGLGRVQLYTSFDRPLSPEELAACRALVARRGKREPVAYILGEREFYGRPFAVDPRVLVPRPDTEVLVDEVLARIDAGAEGVVLDYGTGSGAIACTLAAERPALKLLAVDRSAGALAVAKANAEALGVADRVGFVGSDGLERVPARFAGELLAIVANPPYVPLEDRPGLAPEVRDHEPAEALFAGPDPLLHYRRLAAEAPRWLAPGGLLAVEVGAGQAEAVRALFAEQLVGVESRKDLGGIERVLLARRSG